MKAYIEKLRFFKNNKIITPTPKQVAKNTGVVVAVTAIVGVFVWLADTAAYGLLNLVMSWVS